MTIIVTPTTFTITTITTTITSHQYQPLPPPLSLQTIFTITSELRTQMFHFLYQIIFFYFTK
uniref:Putative ovule protein n=1 Tax=Solanum chacoense TaxID=4108 RepID=A0A0V0I4H2_SOLCH